MADNTVRDLEALRSQLLDNLLFIVKKSTPQEFKFVTATEGNAVCVAVVYVKMAAGGPQDPRILYATNFSGVGKYAVTLESSNSSLLVRKYTDLINRTGQDVTDRIVNMNAKAWGPYRPLSQSVEPS